MTSDLWTDTWPQQVICHFNGPTTCLMHSELSHTEEQNWQGRQETGFPHQYCTPFHWFHLTEVCEKWTWIICSSVVHTLWSDGCTLTWSMNKTSWKLLHSKIPVCNASTVVLLTFGNSRNNASELLPLSEKREVLRASAQNLQNHMQMLFQVLFHNTCLLNRLYYYSQ